MRQALAGLAALAVLLAVPGAAFAHAQLENADPAPGARVARAPTELRLSFSEPVDASFSQIQVLDAQ